jgi:hypothetical protein
MFGALFIIIVDPGVPASILAYKPRSLIILDFPAFSLHPGDGTNSHAAQTLP